VRRRRRGELRHAAARKARDQLGEAFGQALVERALISTGGRSAPQRRTPSDRSPAKASASPSFSRTRSGAGLDVGLVCARERGAQFRRPGLAGVEVQGRADDGGAGHSHLLSGSEQEGRRRSGAANPQLLPTLRDDKPPGTSSRKPAAAVEIGR
jgi:hypothetical protein